VQLPIYNEYYVVEDLLKAVLALDYPKELLEIQVLDDSTDETQALLADLVGQAQAQGAPIVLLHRDNRQGFKAGALAEGLAQAKGEFIAIFDADFRPSPSFLYDTLGYFEGQPRLGLVQVRWHHANEQQSLLTRIQAMVLDAHFSIEHMGRNEAGYFINFNGTAGIWRRSCIEEAGGWQGDTLTEDLDLSFRAQVKGWAFRYVEGIAVPSELPSAMRAVRSQQYRWAKGPAECVRKLWTTLWRSPLPLAQRWHGALHLLNSSLFVASAFLVLLNFPVAWLSRETALASTLGLEGYLTFWGYFSYTIIFAFFFFGLSFFHRRGWSFLVLWRYLSLFPFFLMFFLSLAWHNSWAVLEGYAGRRTPFVRTPKFNLLKPEQVPSLVSFLQQQPLFSVGEWLVFAWSALAFAWACWTGDFRLAIFYGLVLSGYLLQKRYSL
jgi:cellulose synthase/poly-beta-1,6-N-acetylglucosamine synthase-like glycosyltransferase